MEATEAPAQSTQQKAFHHITEFEIDGVKTDLVCHRFVDRILLIITQYEKITNFYSVKSQTFNDDTINQAKIYDIRQKFGEFLQFFEIDIFEVRDFPVVNEIF
jgi:hypothetical protein